MTKSTIRFIFSLMAMLFLNIEAAQAGLISRFRVFLNREFPDYQFPWLLALMMLAGLLLYGLFAPVPIGKEKRVWLHIWHFQSKRQTYEQKRALVSRISGVLQTIPPSNTLHF
jgi:hypothetical protein